jgi:hypothetical protein
MELERYAGQCVHESRGRRVPFLALLVHPVLFAIYVAWYFVIR